MFELVVLTDFEGFKVGDKITDQTKVHEYRETHPMFVVAVKKAKAPKKAAAQKQEQKETV